MDHASFFSEATLIEIGVYIFRLDIVLIKYIILLCLKNLGHIPHGNSITEKSSVKMVTRKFNSPTVPRVKHCYRTNPFTSKISF